MLIDLLLSNRKYYTFENRSAQSVATVLRQKKIPFRTIFLEEGGLPHYWKQLEEVRPDWSLSFSQLIPHQTPLCDILEIPHFYWVEDSLASALCYLDSHYGHLGLCQRSLAQALNQPHIHYLPTGVPALPKKEKVWELLFFADLIDVDQFESIAYQGASEGEIGQMQRAIRYQNPLLAGKYYLYAEQLLQAQKNLKTIEVLSGLSTHIFGDHLGRHWLTKLPKSFFLHSSLPYIEKLDALCQSTILITDPESPWYRVALAANCLPLLPEKEKIEYYLTHPGEREQEIARLRSALNDLTWESQVEKMLKVMSCV